MGMGIIALIFHNKIKQGLKKNPNISTNDFRAHDLFDDWKDLVGSASQSINIFTPYLDDTIIDILEVAGSEIHITIFTCLDGDNLFQRGYQINTLKQLITKGYSVKNLEGLHAKIIVIDQTKVSLGSQNFTKRGRKNKEAGMSSKASFANTEFIDTLEQWKILSKDVSLDMIFDLIEYLEKKEAEILALKKVFDKGIESIISKYQAQDYLEQILNSPNYNTKFRFAQGALVLTRTIPPPNYDYYSFFAGEFNNLCKWIQTGENGEEEIIDLIDYNYYPAINVSTMKMAFLRIHTSRITYMKEEFAMSLWNGYEIGDSKFELEFNFLKTKTNEYNMKVKLKNKMGYFIFHYLFDGIKFDLKKEKYSNQTIEQFVRKNLLTKGEEHLKFCSFLIEPAKFTTPINQPKIIETFLTEYQYKVGIIEFNKVPVLVFN